MGVSWLGYQQLMNSKDTPTLISYESKSKPSIAAILVSSNSACLHDSMCIYVHSEKPQNLLLFGIYFMKPYQLAKSIATVTQQGQAENTVF